MDNDGKPRSRRFFGFRAAKRAQEQENTAEEEILSMVEEGHEKGELQESEARMISNIFEFDDKDAKDIMTHRKNIIAVDGMLPLKEVLDFVRDKQYSRFPVYLEDIDNIIGVIHIRDLLNLVLDSDHMETPIRQIDSLVRRVAFIPETRNIDDLFRKMQTSKMHIVIVIDEYGQTAGLVTMEDILEEIVGNIQDEYDKEEQPIIRQRDGSFLIDGEAQIEEVCEALELNEEEMEDFDTMNGYLISLINRIPEDGEVFCVESSGWQFRALAVENKIIKKVLARKTHRESEASESENNQTQQ